MAEDGQGSDVKNESLMEKIVDKIHGDGSSSSSSSDSELEKRAPESSTKVKIFRLFGREKPLHVILGGGKPADVLLWRNKKVSSGVLAGATAIWVLFELLEYHFLTLICHILIASLIVLFLWANASTFIYKSSPRIPEIRFSEDTFVEVASALRIEINRAFAMLRDVASGRDLKKFLIAVGGLWILSIAGSYCNFLTLFYTTFVLAHTVPVLYEKYERQVDSFGEKAMIQIKKQYAVLDAKLLSKIPRGPLKGKAA